MLVLDGYSRLEALVYFFRYDSRQRGGTGCIRVDACYLFSFLLPQSLSLRIYVLLISYWSPIILLYLDVVMITSLFMDKHLTSLFQLLQMDWGHQQCHKFIQQSTDVQPNGKQHPLQQPPVRGGATHCQAGCSGSTCSIYWNKNTETSTIQASMYHPSS